jgi:hypothetical protein
MQHSGYSSSNVRLPLLLHSMHWKHIEWRLQPLLCMLPTPTSWLCS